ncbi:MAG: extracellular solute-binding protein, partial [Chloroflexi bacterium]
MPHFSMKIKLPFFALLTILLIACNANENAQSTQLTIAEKQATNSVIPDEGRLVERNTLRFVISNWEQNQYQALIEEFEQENPDIEIQLVYIEDILKLEPSGTGNWPEDAAYQIVSEADVINTDLIGPAHAEQGLLLDLQPLLDTDTIFNSDDFYPGLLQYFQLKGMTWAIPNRVQFTLFFFNKDAFDIAEIDYPEPGWTWDEFLSYAKKLTLTNGAETTQWGFVQPYFDPAMLIQAYNGPMFNLADIQTTASLNHPDLIEAVRWITNLHLFHHVAPYLPPAEPNEQGELFSPGGEFIDNGKAAMWIGPAFSWEWRKSQGNVGVVPFPI